MPRIYETTAYCPSAAAPLCQGAHPPPVAPVVSCYDAPLSSAPCAKPQTARLALRAPVVDWQHVAAFKGCLRPVRQGGMHLKALWEGDKLVVHNYGHGGAGWTLAPGVVAEAVRLFDGARQGALADAPITVLGGGVIGLWTALSLASRPNAPHVTLMAEAWEDLTSHNAGGLLAPVSLQDNPGAQRRTQALGRVALAHWESIAQERTPWAARGARQMPVFVGLDTDSGLDTYVRAGLMPPPRDVCVAFAPDKVHPMRVYETLFIDVKQMMHNLTEALAQLGVERVTARVRAIDDIDSDVVFNCTGLGAASVCDDARMTGVQGHLVQLAQQPPAFERDYMIYTQVEPATDARSPDERACGSTSPAYLYYMPKGEGVVGGTFIPGAHSPDEHPEAFAQIIHRAQRFFGT